MALISIMLNIFVLSTILKSKRDEKNSVNHLVTVSHAPTNISACHELTSSMSLPQRSEL